MSGPVARRMVDENETLNDGTEVSSGYSYWKDVLKRVRRNKQVSVGLAIVTIMVVVAVFAPWIAPHDPTEQQPDGIRMGMPLSPFTSGYILGTDHMGRDVLSRLIYGTRVSLLVGFVSTAIAAAIGVVFGVIAGYYGGYADMIIMRLTDVLMAFPSFLLVMATVASLRPGLVSLFIALGVVRWAQMSRLVRGQVLIVKANEYVESGRAIGLGDLRIILRYILPNSWAPVIVSVTMGIAGAILTEASLSFLGLGVQPPTPSWGIMVNEARSYLFARPLLVFFPSLAIAIAVLGFSILGDGLRDVLDPRLRGTE
ncbi:MAG: ABC transporter permease [Bacillota bacterium]